VSSHAARASKLGYTAHPLDTFAEDSEPNAELTRLAAVRYCDWNHDRRKRPKAEDQGVTSGLCKDCAAELLLALL
jgi:hypothetical protein